MSEDKQPKEEQIEESKEEYSEIPWDELLSGDLKKNIEIQFDDSGNQHVRINLYEE